MIVGASRGIVGAGPRRGLVLGSLMAVLLLPWPLAVGAQEVQPRDADSPAHQLLVQVEDRQVRRSLIDRYRRGEVDLDGIREVVAKNREARQSRTPTRSRATPLGVTFDETSNRTLFRVFSPKADSVVLGLYQSPEGEEGEEYPMTRSRDGIWQAEIEGSRTGWYYDFSASGPDDPAERFDPAISLSDPYALSNVRHDGRSIVVDGAFSWTDQDFQRPGASEYIIYETHVKGFTAHESSGVPPSKRGRYLGFVEGAEGDRVLGHLKDLGVTAVELLPVHEFDNNAAPPGHINYWGYMTSHFFAPETSYASGATRGEAVREMKALVNGLHEAGIAVVLDVVYNHTTEGDHRGPTLNLKGLANSHYYRLTPEFFYWNGTGVGNEVASENAMTRRLILDSLRYWRDDYHIDGFRFDLAASLDAATIRQIESQFPEMFLTGEPWTADWNRRQWDRGQMRGARWSFWNDDFRETVRSFVFGQADRNALMTVISGSCFTWAGSPLQSLNYVEAHDGYTLADLTHGDRRRNRLATVVLFSSLGVPMIQGGQELMKDKGGNHNSYDQDNLTNWIDWSLKEKNRDIYEFYRGMIDIRLENDALRRTDCLDESTVEWLRPGNTRALGYRLASPTGGNDVLVLLNSDENEWVTFGLPGSGGWTVLCNGEQARAEGLGTARNSYRVPPLSGVVLSGRVTQGKMPTSQQR